MRCLRIYSSSDGKSHFDEVDIPTTKRAIFPDTVPLSYRRIIRHKRSASLASQRVCAKLVGTRCLSACSL